ncbi:MAG: acyl-CoA dehydrogenase [Boseongicola sp.]|nr:MAG: acyl-CoA dehydrogenase [Boseongicola sp.]
MPTFAPPLRDMQFVLHELLRVSEAGIPGYQDLDQALTNAVLSGAGKIASEVLQPLNAVGDFEGCTFEDGVVRAPTGFNDAYTQICNGGWTGLDGDPAFGGQGMPYLMQTAVGELFSAANMAFQMYLGLSHGAASAIAAHGTDEQKETYLHRLNSGQWTGTMNLTEPQCGTDLSLIKTRAQPQNDGSYQITGQKIWISSGEHDLCENIVHLVLARLPESPNGVKGISMFVVPKFLPDPDRNLGERNSVTCGGLESKMGIHGNATCIMNYEGATGWLIGKKHKGMRAMFTMMNEARHSVAVQGYAQSEVAYQNAIGFARDRLQGRDVTGPQNPDEPADPIIVHPDVRRNLLDQKAFIEAARALAFGGALLIDRSQQLGDEHAQSLVSLLIPVMKGFLTDKGFESCVNAQQTFGGTGFTRDAGIEQFVRDARITMIYEGTNGVQSLDLVGRKLPMDGGKSILAFFDIVKSFIKENETEESLRTDFLDPLKSASKDLQSAAMYFMNHAQKSPNSALAGSYDFMHLFGHVALGLMWARMAKVSQTALSSGTQEQSFYQAKLESGRYYMARHLPATKLHLARIKTGANPVMALKASSF